MTCLCPKCVLKERELRIRELEMWIEALCIERAFAAPDKWATDEEIIERGREAALVLLA